MIQLLLLGAGMGVVGGLFPSPLHMIALAQVGLNRWGRAIFVLVGPPLAIDGTLLLLTFFFYQYVPHNIAHGVAYLGGVMLTGFATYSLAAARGKTREEIAQSAALTYSSVTVASAAELTAPGTWIYWLTIAGPIISEGREIGYLRVVPFFVGSAAGYYGVAIAAVWLMAWGASLHRQLNQRLFLAANLLLLVLGLSYLLRAYLAG
jgi:hypothetical protein